MEYSKNLKIIKELRPDLYGKLKDIDLDKLEETSDSITVTQARDGNLITVVEQNGKQVRLNSAFRPIEEAQKWVQQYKFENMNNNVTMYGFGNGYFVQELLNNMQEKDFLLIYEPSKELFIHSLHNFNLESILTDPRVIIGIEGLNEFEFHRALHSIYGMENLVNNKIIICPGFDKLFVEQIEQFKAEIKESAVSARIEYNTLLKFAKSNLKNMFVNIPKLRGSISITQLQDIWNKDIPAIVVAAGPSLEDNLEELRWAKGKAIIVAVDRIVQYLLDREIEPDFVITIDPQKSVKHFSSGKEIDIPMFCMMASQPLIMDKQVGRKILCSAGLYMYKYYMDALNDCPNVELNGSVATFAVQVLRDLGTKKICLVGQDLAYHGEATHVGGVVSNPNGTAEKWTEGLNGEKVKTRYDWIEFKIWLEDFIVRNPDLTLIDTKKQGALIKGSTQMGLKEAIGNVDVSIESLLDLVNAVSPALQEKQFLDIQEQMMSEKEELSKMKKKAKEGIGYCTDLIMMVKQGKTLNSNLDSKVGKVKEITEYLSEVEFYKNLDQLVIGEMKRDYVKVFSSKEDEMEELLNVYDSSRSFFEAVLESVKFIEPVMGETIQKLEEQIKEHQ